MASCLYVENENLICSIINLNDGRVFWVPKDPELVSPGSFLLFLTFLILSFVYVNVFIN
jgi:hypothetical protein